MRWVAPPEPLPSPNVIEPPATTSTPGTAQRVGNALGRRSNWEQLAKFCVVGASGYVVNLGVYVLLFKFAGSTTCRPPSGRSSSPWRTTTR